MESEKIIIKGTPKRNNAALIIMIIGIVLIIASFIIAGIVYKEGTFYKSYGYGYGLTYYYYLEYSSFFEFYIYMFFSTCVYGYIFVAGFVSTVVGLIMKFNSEKCEITVTSNSIFGKVSHGKEVSIPLNQVTDLHTCSFDGVSVVSIGKVSKFHCFANREEIMKAISYLIANSQSNNRIPSNSNVITNSGSSNSETEQIKKFKELLDSGAITQDEFNAKKKQILGL